MLWRFEIWENQFNSHTIITVWWGLSPSRYILQLPHTLEYTLAIIFKAFFYLFSFQFLCIFLFKQIMHGHIRKRKEIPNDGKLLTFQFCYIEAHKCHWHYTFAMSKHTGVILWWFEIWENHFNSHTIITIWWKISPSRYILQLPHLLEYTISIMYKAFWFFLFFIFLLSKSCMDI